MESQLPLDLNDVRLCQSLASWPTAHARHCPSCPSEARGRHLRTVSLVDTVHSPRLSYPRLGKKESWSHHLHRRCGGAAARETGVPTFKIGFFFSLIGKFTANGFLFSLLTVCWLSLVQIEICSARSCLQPSPTSAMVALGRNPHHSRPDSYVAA